MAAKGPVLDEGGGGDGDQEESSFASATVDDNMAEKFSSKNDGTVGKVEEEQIQKVALMGHDRDQKIRSHDVKVSCEDDMDFVDMQLSDDIINGLKLCRYDKPTPIQLKAIPLGGMNYDLLLQAKSGTGKTCVFTVCILQQIDLSEKVIQAIVVSPCREIAVQISYVMKSIGAFMSNLKVKEFIGGTSVAQSMRRSTNCHIAVGTPGRLAHMINEERMDLSNVKVIALDEADKLMDPSFYEDVKIIFKALPETKQMIATSATYSDNVCQFLEVFMKNVCKIQLNLDDPTLCAVDQYMIDAKKMIGINSKQSAGGGREMAEMNEAFDIKFNCLKEIFRGMTYKQAIIFSNYQLRAEKIYDLLKEMGWDVDLLSGGRSQEDRLSAFIGAQQGKTKLLVATDVASRGIDIEGVDLVINFDVPKDSDTYIHRVGRTGRFGSNGVAMSICYFDSEHKVLSEFQLNLHFTLWVIENSEEIGGINAKNKIRHVTRKLTVVRDSDIGEGLLSLADTDCQQHQEDLKAAVISIVDQGLQKISFDEIDHMMDSRWNMGTKPVIQYEDMGEEHDWEPCFKRRLATVEARRIAHETGTDPNSIVLQDALDDPFSSDEEDDDDEHYCDEDTKLED